MISLLLVYVGSGCSDEASSVVITVVMVVAAESLINEDLTNSDELLCYPVTLTYTLPKSCLHFIYLSTGAVGSGPAFLTIIQLR